MSSSNIISLSLSLSPTPKSLSPTPKKTKNSVFVNLEGCSSIGQPLGLFPRGYQFESHKPQGYWRLT